MSGRGCVGVIGLGLMGIALSERFLKGGFSVIGFDVDPVRGEMLERLGGVACGSPSLVLEQVERCVLSLPNSDVVGALIDEVTGSLKAGQLILDTTTGDPLRTAEVGRELAELGVGYADGTISGSSQQTLRGEVIVMLGGTDADAERVRDLLACFATRSFHLGPCGAGARMKLVSNLVLGLNRAVLAEGLSLARSLGLNLETTLEVLKEGMSYSRIMETKGEKMLARDYAPQAKLAQHLKDVELIRQEAKRQGMGLPFSEAHAEILRVLVSEGLGELDNSAVQEFFLRERDAKQAE